jgi:hypothetical protein
MSCVAGGPKLTDDAFLEIRGTMCFSASGSFGVAAVIAATGVVMGGLLAVALVATFVIKRNALVSTWCFFAAIFSGIIVASIAAEHKLAAKPA